MGNPRTSLQVHWIDAFTRTPFTGNPAVVVPDAAGLTDVQMQQIAREVNCSETAFVLPAGSNEADLRLRWMTPTQEVDLCGHATVAAFHALAELRRFNLRPGTQQLLYLDTRVGILPITVDYTDATAPWVWLTLPTCEFEVLTPRVAQQLKTVLGVPPTVDAVQLPVQDSLNHDVLLEVQTLKQLQGLQPDVRALAALGRDQGWRGICVYTQETLDPQSWAHSRFFAPQSGILEDPVTGSVSGPLALYLAPSQDQPREAAVSHDLILEQGDCLGRAGRVRIQLTGQTPKLGGQALTVMQGEMYL